jgi:Ni/Co efflux regulator RcnB
MRKLLMAGLMATSLLPAAAQAQWIDRGEARELHRDREDIRVARDDYRDARREYREDYRDARRDWHGRDWRGGWYERRGYYEPRRHFRNWDRYGDARPYGHQRWVRNGRDALLIDIRNGYVIRVIRNHYW